MRSVLISAVCLTAGLSGGLPVGAGEFKGDATFHFTFHGLSIISISETSYYSAGVADGPNVFAGGDAALANIAQHCLGTTNLDGSGSGVCHNLDPAGDGWKETYSYGPPGATPSPGSLETALGKSEVIVGSGTGKFANMKGGSIFVQDVTGVLYDGYLVGRSVQTYNLSY